MLQCKGYFQAVASAAESVQSVREWPSVDIKVIIVYQTDVVQQSLLRIFLVYISEAKTKVKAMTFKSKAKALMPKAKD